MYNYLVEFIGTTLLIYVILATNNPLAIGFMYAFILLLTHEVTTGYFNPAVAIMMAATDKMQIGQLVPICLAQIFGGLIAYEIFKRTQVAEPGFFASLFSGWR